MNQASRTAQQPDGTAEAPRKVPLSVTSRRVLWAAIGTVLVALVVRLIHVADTSAFPSVKHLVGDAAGYTQWAEKIVGGDWIGTDPFYQAPLYPYFLAVCFQLLGSATWVIRVVQCVLGAGGVWFLYRGTRDLFGERVAPGDPLCTLVDPMLIEVPMPQARDLPSVFPMPVAPPRPVLNL